MNRARRTTPPGPWGRLVGMLAGFGSTLVGIIGRLDPHIILLRAAASAFLVGLTVAFGMALVRTIAARDRPGRDRRLTPRTTTPSN